MSKSWSSFRLSALTTCFNRLVTPVATRAGDLRGDGRSRGDEDGRQKSGDQYHHDSKRQQVRKPGNPRQGARRSVQHDRKQDTGKDEEDRGLRVPQRRGEHGNDAERGPDGGVG